MNKMSKNALFALLLVTASTQIHCFMSEALWREIYVWLGQTTREELIEQHLNKLEEDLIGKPHERIALVIPQHDVNRMKIFGRAELEKQSYQELTDEERSDLILRSMMVEYVKKQTSALASRHTNNDFVINSVTNIIGDSFRNRLEHTPNRNGQALQEFFGTNLEHKVRSSFHNPTYTEYYQHAR